MVKERLVMDIVGLQGLLELLVCQADPGPRDLLGPQDKQADRDKQEPLV